MKKPLFILITIFSFQVSLAQNNSAFQDGEWFKFKMSYSGWLKAGNATLTVNETRLDERDVYHVVGKGWTTGAIKWFFKVEDLYESYFDKNSNLPYKFIRKIDEGGHTKDIEIVFNQETREAKVNNKKRKKVSTIATKANVQDMVSAFYYLRNNYETDKIEVGDEVKLNMFFDEENYLFRLKFLGRETIKTKFGRIETLKFRPYVLAGRVFKEQESLTLWVSADENKIPLKVKADLAVGSLRADLEAFKGLKHSFKIVVKN
ncbi:DUF3108 domain-containing protein [Winogradskyella immobilis]|uniref:DUF3108 domain-containing protein n=1 Tax=Winogradskyella immobilis TaxID=2816852 RepID=A0ABS8EIU2_9FLAO|nr:DUF3108 domain-containing protein [Winogradskyella immobilis]MCC1482961.1 DUF3108 domain-containing protein [Winogradskyella immobilis]MCG0015056.1 DUF3108 domain-containing protein [Winogradskyella immobilis]